MANVQSFVNNPYQENTCILFDDSKECVIVDPGMYTAAEQNAVVGFIKQNGLTPAAVVAYAPAMGFRYDASPLPDEFLPEEGTVSFGNTQLQLIFAPGHSPAHLCFYDKDANILIGGDVLFRNSIGRTDLPGGNYSQLIKNIEEKLFLLPDDCTVYPGHGPETTIGYEKQHNPYL